jgi:hypothetical protein
VKTRGVTVLPANKILALKFLTKKKDPNRGSEQSHTPYGEVKSGWHEQWNSSLSQAASSLVCLLHCTLKNLIVLRRVTRSF